MDSGFRVKIKAGNGVILKFPEAHCLWTAGRIVIWFLSVRLNHYDPETM